MMRNIGNKRSIIIFFMIMFCMAVIENIKGVIVPQVKDYYQVTSVDISYMLTWSSLAYILFTFYTGNIANRIGQKTTEFLSVSFIVLACITMVLAPNFIVFILGMIFLNAGLALNGVIINSVVPVLAVGAQSVIVNTLHFMYGFGASAGQTVTSIFLGRGQQFQSVYLFLGIVFMLLMVLSLRIHYPETPIRENQELNHLPNKYRDYRFYLMTLAMGLYIFAEIGLGNWLVDYFYSTQGMTEDQAGTYIALFFLFLAIGRLLGGFIIDRIGKFKSIIAGALIGAALIILGLCLKGQAYYLISLAGLFYSIVFPTAVLLISRLFKHDIAFITGKILTFNSIGSMIYNQLVGYVIDGLGFEVAIFMMPLAAILSAGIFYILYRQSQLDRTEEIQ